MIKVLVILCRVVVLILNKKPVHDKDKKALIKYIKKQSVYGS